MSDPNNADLDRLRTFQEAADALELPYFKIQRAARRKLIPTYSILNSRKWPAAGFVDAQLS